MMKNFSIVEKEIMNLKNYYLEWYFLML